MKYWLIIRFQSYLSLSFLNGHMYVRMYVRSQVFIALSSCELFLQIAKLQFRYVVPFQRWLNIQIKKSKGIRMLAYTSAQEFRVKR